MQFKTRPKSKTLINITSLIDVLFMMLLFVLISSSFVEKPGIKLDLPGTQNAETVRAESYTLFVNKEGDLFLNEQRLTQEALLTALEKALPQMKDQALTLDVDQNVSHGLVVKLMDIAKKSGIKKLVIGTQQKKTN